MLAAERDRALRALASEEDRRRDLVEELGGLLGGELSCGDVSRLVVGLERIEREELAPGEGEGEGDAGRTRRTWVLEVSGLFTPSIEEEKISVIDSPLVSRLTALANGLSSAGFGGSCLQLSRRGGAGLSLALVLVPSLSTYAASIARPPSACRPVVCVPDNRNPAAFARIQ